MKVLKLDKKNYKEVLKIAAAALRKGQTVVYPTDTSYGLAALGTNAKGIAKVYKIKERGFNQPVHVVVPSVAASEKYVYWTKDAKKRFAKYLPGPLTVVLPIKSKNKNLIRLTAKTGFLGIRIPKNGFALELAKIVGPITATSANPAKHLSGGFDPYNLKDIEKNFEPQKHKPDLIIDAGILKKVKPSTVVKIDSGEITVLRKGPILIPNFKK